MADYGLLAGLGEGLQKGLAAYMEGRKLKTQEDMDALKMALLTRQAKAEEEKSRRDEMKTALQYASDLGHMPSSGFSEETLRGFGIAPKVEGVGVLPESGDPLQKDRPDGLIKLPGLMGKAERQQLSDIDRANTTLVPQGFMAKAKEGGGYEVVVMPENEKQRLAREKHESELKAREIEESLKKAQEEKIRAETAAIGKKTRLMGTGPAKLAPEISKQINEMAGSMGKQRVSFNLVDQLFKQTSNKNIDEGQRVNLALEQLKLLNSALGSDAVGAEEVKRLAGWLDYMPHPSIGKWKPAPNIDKFNEQLQASRDRIGGSINALGLQIKELKGGGSGLMPSDTIGQPQAQPQTPQIKSNYVPMRDPKTGQPKMIREDLVDKKKREGWTPMGK